MDLSVFFNDVRVKSRKTHIVMQSVGVESEQFKGFQVPVKVDDEGNPAVELFPANQKAEMESWGWKQLFPTTEPVDAKVKKA